MTSYKAYAILTLTMKKAIKNMLYAIIDVKSSLSLKVSGSGYNFAPHGFPAIYPISKAEDIAEELNDNDRKCVLKPIAGETHA